MLRLATVTVLALFLGMPWKALAAQKPMTYAELQIKMQKEYAGLIKKLQADFRKATLKVQQQEILLGHLSQPLQPHAEPAHVTE